MFLSKELSYNADAAISADLNLPPVDITELPQLEYAVVALTETIMHRI